MSTVIQCKPEQLTKQQSNLQKYPGAAIPWIVELRENAFKEFEAAGLPSPRIEDWKYTNLKALQRQSFYFHSEHAIEISENDITSAVIPDLDVYRVVFVDGLINEQLSQIQEISSKVHIVSLKDKLSHNDKLTKKYLTKIANPGLNGFVALNTALMHDGIQLYLPKKVVADKPIHLIYISTVRDNAAWINLRNLIVAEPNSEAIIIESFLNLGDSVYLNNITTEISLAENSKLTHYKFQQEAMPAFHVSLLNVQQKQCSKYSSHSFAFGGKFSRNEMRIGLDEPGSECILQGLYLADGRQQIDTLAKVDHNAESCLSREFFKGIINGKAKAIYRGIAYVHPNAQHSDAEQINNNLLLSSAAEVDTKPQLEIYADDVKCSHGATVGQLDEDALFYLRSRGIEEDTARGLLTYSFAKEIIDNIQVEPLARHVDSLFKETHLNERRLEN